MYNGQYDTGHGDFICFGMRGSKPEFRFDVGSGPAIIQGNHSLELNKWHTVQLKRNRRDGMHQLIMFKENNLTSELHGGLVPNKIKFVLFLVYGIMWDKNISSNINVNISDNNVQRVKG